MNDAQIEDLIDVKKAARRLGLAPKTLYEMVRTRKVPYFKIGRAVRFDPRDLEKFKRGCRVEAD